MAATSFKVNDYEYYLWSSRTTGKANLNLYGDDMRCAIWFVEDPEADLPAASMPRGDHVELWYHQWQMPALVDMLRNESPVFVFFDDDNDFPNSRISTSQEPVGEGERRA